MNLTLRRRKARDTPAPVYGAIMPVLDVRIAQIEALGSVHVTIDPHFMPEECGWCDSERPAVTSVRVYGNPASDDVTHPLEMEEVCLDCALGEPAAPGRGERVGAVRQALIERANTDHDIRVEVCE